MYDKRLKVDIVKDLMRGYNITGKEIQLFLTTNTSIIRTSGDGFISEYIKTLGISSISRIVTVFTQAIQPETYHWQSFPSNLTHQIKKPRSQRLRIETPGSFVKKTSESYKAYAQIRLQIITEFKP